MTPPPTDADRRLADAERQHAALDIQIEAMQATLVRLLQDVIDAEAALDRTQVARLVEANEQLVMSALENRAKADSAAMALDEFKESSGLDALTRLPTRHVLDHRFAQAVAAARRHNARLALLFVDLDDFKQINDRHGHAFGDQVLCLAAQRLASAVREGDAVSRHGGDEFLVLLAEVGHAADAQAVADKLTDALAVPTTLDGWVVRLKASVGVAVYPDDGEDLETLTAHADAAMYAHKRARAGRAAAGLAPVQPGPADALHTPAAAPAPGLPPAAGADDAERALADLRDANEQLVLATLGARALQEAADHARQRQQAFMAAVTDELRNPMAPIRIATTMLGRLPAETTLLPRVKQVIEEQMLQMSRLVERLVDAAEPAGPEPALDRAWVDMVEVTDAAIGLFRPVLRRHRLRLAWQRPAAPIGVVGDAARLAQIVSNLLDNACIHTPKGGRIGLTLQVQAQTVVLTVVDDGMGITAQELPDVFEPFALDLQTLGVQGVGRGVGLTVARSLVQAHGGQIAAHSDGTRRGSRFVVTLPLAPPAAPADSPTPASPPTPDAPADGSGDAADASAAGGRGRRR